jgi:putative transposase
MKTNIELLQPDGFYHIYNRGINGENIFKEERNYSYFLQRYAHYIEPFAETYAYCLLKNHFHILIKTRTENDIRTFLSEQPTLQKEGILLPKYHNKTIEWIYGNSFASFFKSYAISINNACNRTGSLFEEPFRRILVDNDDYFTKLIYYIHHNPQKHGFVKDFREYPHSSYHSHLHTALTKLKRDDVINWFGDRNEFERFHVGSPSLDNLDKFIIEFE